MGYCWLLALGQCGDQVVRLSPQATPTPKSATPVHEPRCPPVEGDPSSRVYVQVQLITTDGHRGLAATSALGRGGLAVPGGRDGSGNHCRVQRALSRTATLVRLPHHAAVGDRALDCRARRCDPVAISELSNTEELARGGSFAILF